MMLADSPILPGDVTALASLGPVGILFAMWWWERQGREAALRAAIDAAEAAKRSASSVDMLITTIRDATAAMTRLAERIEHRDRE